METTRMRLSAIVEDVDPRRLDESGERMNQIIYIVGFVVVVLAILAFLGFR
jgi:hypothetical protein